MLDLFIDLSINLCNHSSPFFYVSIYPFVNASIRAFIYQFNQIFNHIFLAPSNTIHLLILFIGQTPVHSKLLDRWMDGWMDGRTDGRTDGQTYRQIDR